jgi:uncharacterized C2H2 Zn-finger protein
MIFQCARCQKNFDNKTHYNKHLARKIPCKEIINNIIDHDVNIKNGEVSNPTLYVSNVVSNPTPSSQNLDCTPLENNIFINSKNNGFKCLVCNIIYKHSQTLSNHKKSKHPNYDIDIKHNTNRYEKTEIEQLR